MDATRHPLPQRPASRRAAADRPGRRGLARAGRASSGSTCRTRHEDVLETLAERLWPAPARGRGRRPRAPAPEDRAIRGLLCARRLRGAGAVGRADGPASPAAHRAARDHGLHLARLRDHRPPRTGRRSRRPARPSRPRRRAAHRLRAAGSLAMRCSTTWSTAISSRSTSFRTGSRRSKRGSSTGPPPRPARGSKRRSRLVTTSFCFGERSPRCARF